MRRAEFEIYLITDRNQCGGEDMVRRVESALLGGVSAVQLREKDLSARGRYELGQGLRKITSSFGAKLLVNGDAALALAIGADGVHLPQDGLPVEVCRGLLGPDLLLGVSAHSLTEAIEAQAGGADFITFGPVYSTRSKASYGPPVGLESLRAACAAVEIPVFALGGVGADAIEEALSAGACGVAMISAILSEADPESAASKIAGILSRAREAEGQAIKKG